MFTANSNIVPFDDFESASRAVLAMLRERLGFGLWMMTRTEGEEWVVLQAEDHGYDVKEGTVFSWADSFCSQMVKGLGPRIAPNAAEVPAYLSAPIGQQVEIGAYIGVPMWLGDGSLFGTLCAIDPSPHPRSICAELPNIELMARLLGTVLERDLKQIEQNRLLEQSLHLSLTDELTGIANRRGWNRAMESEEVRARSYGGPACVFVIDLDELKELNDSCGHAAGDQLIQRAATVLRKTVKETDVVARIGGDEFCILALDYDEAEGRKLTKKLREKLVEEDVQASIGCAVRKHSQGFNSAMREADVAMYKDKAARKQKKSDAVSSIPVEVVC